METPDFRKNLNQETTQIDFYQAMQDFKIMFPVIEDDVIEEVLRANQGAVDATIDQLLAMSTDYMNEALRRDLEKSETGNTGKMGEDKNKFFDPPDVTKNETSFVVGKTNYRKWSPPLLGPLPSTFLRIECLQQKSLTECYEDERIAFFLQNEEFLSELQINQDFLSTLEPSMEGKGSSSSEADIFKERLKNMGKISRTKFAQLSRVFQRRKKNRSCKGILDQNTSGDSMLLAGEPLLLDGQDEPARKE